MKALRLPIAYLTAAILTACGGGQPAQDATEVASEVESEPTDEGSDNEASDEVKWLEMNDDQKMEFMGLVVMPEMKKVFQAADPQGYAEFKCQTCHGEDAKDKGFKMPNGLFALEKPNPMPAAQEYDAEVTAFMADVVVPKMAALMSMGPNEFGCFNCHETE